MGEQINDSFVSFCVCWLVICFVWFIICLPWLISARAGGWFPVLFQHFLEFLDVDQMLDLGPLAYTGIVSKIQDTYQSILDI